jgi:molybdopterin-guanine dinucleotide biosynthesis protein A
MLGIILCGGKSLRMGSDKGLLKLEAKTWAQTAIDRISVLQMPVAVSVNKEQFVAYAQIFKEDDLVADDTSLSIGGPLLGLLSCHLKNPGEDLFALGCDMPLMESSILEKLYDVYKQQPGSEVYIYTNEGEPEPLCAIYTAKGLAKIINMLQKGELVKHSMKFMIDHLTVQALPIKEEQKKYFRNFNAHAELNGL